MKCGGCPGARKLEYIAPDRIPDNLRGKPLEQLRMCVFDYEVAEADHECDIALETLLTWWGNAQAIAEARFAAHELYDEEAVDCGYEPFWEHLKSVAPQIVVEFEFAREPEGGQS